MRRGRFEQAEHGTLFLDEIGDMPAIRQFLKVVEDSVSPRGGDERAAQRLASSAHESRSRRGRRGGKFRADLYRINVLQIALPPLREMPEDSARSRLPARRLGATVDQIEPDAMQMLVAYDWPGNVRELKNVPTGGCRETARSRASTRGESRAGEPSARLAGGKRENPVDDRSLRR
jgi:transcriptional regulator with PAS, ATPase and Fis domain